MENNIKDILNIIEDSIKDVEIEHFNIYNVCSPSEKLIYTQNKDGSLSFKVLKNYILLKFYPMKKINDAIEIRNFEGILPSLKEKFNDIKHPADSNFFRISISSIEDINNISNEISYIFKNLFIQYISNEESFGCCSKYEECSNNKQCVDNNIRFRMGCIYKKNLDDGKIFYGINKNI